MDTYLIEQLVDGSTNVVLDVHGECGAEELVEMRLCENRLEQHRVKLWCGCALIHSWAA
jgi:hypothetical protein